MITVSDDFQVDKDKARDNPELVADLAKKTFGCLGECHGSQDVMVFNDPSVPIATIYYKVAMIELHNPLYAEEARRFAEAFEIAFARKDEEITIHRRY